MSDTFCILPFINVCTERNGDLQACQQSNCSSNSNIYTEDIETGWNNEYFRNLRMDLLNGVKNSNCIRCWEADSRGLVSKRVKSNFPLNEELNNAIADCKNNNGYLNIAPSQLDVKLSNTCNLKCLMCTPYHSSSHETEVKLMRKQGLPVPEWIEYIDAQFGSKMKAPKGNMSNNLKNVLGKVDILLIDGGEPLSSPDLHAILDYCIEQDYTHLKIGFVTNLTNISNNILDKLNKFKEASLFISWDHDRADYFKYIRYPADYNQFLNNFDKLCETNIQRGISLAISILNIYQLPRLIDMYESLHKEGKLNTHSYYRLVQQPDYLSIEYMEPEQRQEVKELLIPYSANEDIANICRILDEHPIDFDHVVKERTRILRMYDKLRSTDYRSLFPYIKDYE